MCPFWTLRFAKWWALVSRLLFFKIIFLWYQYPSNRDMICRTCRAYHCAGIPINEELILYPNHLYWNCFCSALSEQIIVLQSYEDLVLYINNQHFPSNTKVKTYKWMWQIVWIILLCMWTQGQIASTSDADCDWLGWNKQQENIFKRTWQFKMAHWLVEVINLV